MDPSLHAEPLDLSATFFLKKKNSKKILKNRIKRWAIKVLDHVFLLYKQSLDNQKKTSFFLSGLNRTFLTIVPWWCKKENDVSPWRPSRRIGPDICEGDPNAGICLQLTMFFLRKNKIYGSLFFKKKERNGSQSYLNCFKLGGTNGWSWKRWTNSFFSNFSFTRWQGVKLWRNSFRKCMEFFTDVTRLLQFSIGT